jgi:type IX secretion system PorP/SprF family membrane protein
MKKLILGLIAIVALMSEVNAQQDALFSQYMFNPFAINPAYAGSRNSMSGVVLARKQWAGIDGAPTTGSFALHSPFKGKNFALGFNGVYDKIGPATNAGAFATYAYHLKVGPGKLSLGLRGGVYSNRLDNSVLVFNDGSDSKNTGEVFQKMVPTFDFGGYYYTNKFYLGLSANHLIASGTFNIDSVGSINGGVGSGSNVFSTYDRHLSLATGVALVVNPNVVLKPSLLVKYVHGAPVNVDVNFSVLLNKVFWIGASFRSSKAIVGIMEYNITDFVRVGYSYDFSFGAIRSYTTGSHELFLGFDLSVGNKKKAYTTRFL